MAEQRARNRKMFWRIIRRLFGANRGRLFVVLLALGSGAAITAALLNLQVDAKKRLTTEFRSFGANIVVSPRVADSSQQALTMDQAIADRVPSTIPSGSIETSSFLYSVVKVSAANSTETKQAVLAGFQGSLVPAGSSFGSFASTLVLFINRMTSNHEPACVAGQKVASTLHLEQGGHLILGAEGRQQSCEIALIAKTGGQEDNQILVNLKVAQQLTNLAGRISLIQVSASGTPAEIGRYAANLQTILPETEVRPIRQFTEAEGKIYDRISGLLTATVAIVLLLTGLCVLAAMTNVAMERRNDVGLMKAIGGSVRRVVRFFLVEAALLGLIAGLLGAAAGLAISTILGKAVFGVAAQPRLIVYPVAVVLTVIVAILSSFPLRRLASIRPASVFRGES